MPILDVNNKDKVDKYNEFLKNHNASVMQDLRWGLVKSDWITKAIYLEENDNIIACMTILLKKTPIFNSYLLYSPKGPVCDITDIDKVTKLVREVDILAKKYKAYVLKFDPECIFSETLKKLYIDSNFKVTLDVHNIIQPRYNMVLDIKDKKEEDLLKQFSSKTRYNIKVAIRKGVTIRYSRDEEDLKAFYELYKITTIRDNIGCRSYDYFKKMIYAFTENEIRIYVAEHEGDKLASAIAINYGKRIFYIYGASGNEKRNLMPNYLMQWEMIKWGIENKCNNYDFGGVFEFTNENGLYKFKSGFCKKEGATEYIGEIDKVYKPIVYFMYTKLAHRLQRLKKVIKKIIKM